MKWWRHFLEKKVPDIYIYRLGFETMYSVLSDIARQCPEPATKEFAARTLTLVDEFQRRLRR